MLPCLKIREKNETLVFSQFLGKVVSNCQTNFSHKKFVYMDNSQDINFAL